MSRWPAWACRFRGSALAPLARLTLAQVAPVLPYLLLVVMLVVRPKGSWAGGRAEHARMPSLAGPGPVLLAHRWCFRRAALSLLSQMGTMVLLCLSYNMLLGEGGMLSSGMRCIPAGGLRAIHPDEPHGRWRAGLSGDAGAAGGRPDRSACAVVLGYPTTRRAGTTFAMITLGLVELVSACVLMFPEVFGGEGGISGNRVIGEPVLGISYGPQIQVYYLIAGWLLVCAMAICALRHTPLGRILNAVRDNPERAAFIGYDPQVRYLALILSAFFAGVSGGLSAINFEIVSAEYGRAALGRHPAVHLHRRHRLFLRPIVGGVVAWFSRPGCRPIRRPGSSIWARSSSSSS
jgi:branched-chain amino acid transport system permease protein